MGQGRIISIIGSAAVMLMLGAIGGWWFLRVDGLTPQATSGQLAAEGGDAEQANVRLRTENQQLQQDNAALLTSITELSRRVAALEYTKTAEKPDGRQTEVIDIKSRVTALEAGIRGSEQANARLRTANRQLQQDSGSLQSSVVELRDRLAVLEDTKALLEDTVARMKKQLETASSRRNLSRVASRRPRAATASTARRQPQNNPSTAGANAKPTARPPDTLQSLAKDRLALLLVAFLTRHANASTNWFNAPKIQAIGGEQGEFVLFQYHSWATIDAKLRNMERLGLVQGRLDAGPHVSRQFAIRHGEPLITFLTLASTE